MKDLKKIAVVTGANRGLGLETSKRLIELNYIVIMCARDFAKIQTITQTIDSTGNTAVPFQLDVTDDVAIEKLAQHIEQTYGHLDVLVNNAGILLETQDAWDSPTSSIFYVPIDWAQKTFDVNTLGALRMIQALAPMLKKSLHGRIVNVSSSMGQLSEMSGHSVAYRLSKAALNALTIIAAAEFEDTPVKVNSICPGWVKTDMGGPTATRSVAAGARVIIWAATLDDSGPTGGFFKDEKPMPW